ncbi:hypothetical protein OOZ15_12550, partial [Galbibacter sp. EGI 63066]|nr:hypothetical protein [Galbibacter sp. EGI 63066]
MGRALLCILFLSFQLSFSANLSGLNCRVKESDVISGHVPRPFLYKPHDSVPGKNPVRVPKDSLGVSNDGPLQPVIKNTTTRSFKSLDGDLPPTSFSYRPPESEFTPDYINTHFPQDSTINTHVLEAKAAIDQLEASQNFLDLVTPQDLVTLPVGIQGFLGDKNNPEGNVSYILGISKARFTPEYTEVTAFVKITIPQQGADGRPKELFFGADNIKLSHQGGIYGEANLVLLGDVAIPISAGNGLVVLRGGFNMQTGDTDKETYVTIDCSGFRELGLSADVLFPRSMLEPVDQDYKVIPDPDAKVTGHFRTIVSDWNDIMAEISLPPFQLTKKDSQDGSGKAGLVFELNTAVFDFSDLRNSPNTRFPEQYRQLLIPGQEQLWRGVYVNSLKVVLPEQFKIRNSEQRVSFQAADMLIDGMGVSGYFSVDNLLPLNEGEASGWQFSVDHIEADFVANQLTGAGFNGQLVLPVTKEVTTEELQKADTMAIRKKALAYGAIIDPVNEEYILSAGLQEHLSFDVFKAKANLEANSYVELKTREGRFRPKAILHGSLDIAASNSDDPDKKTADFKGIVFEHLQLQTESPYFQVDYMGYQGEVKLANFPVTISEIGVTANEYEASLHFGVDINMMEKGFSGGTSLALVGKFSEKDGYHRWNFD